MSIGHTKIPKLTLNNGQEIPIFGLGTGSRRFSGQAVKNAIDFGYRSFDTAFAYQNEKQVGAEINEKIAEGVVNRQQLFITSKLWSTAHRPDLVIPALKGQLKDLRLEYLDLYLMHAPVALKEDTNEHLFPVGPQGETLFSDVDYVETWKEMEKAVEAGLVKSIGLSNFNSEQINRILELASIKPVMNQIECHPFLSQEKLIDFCNSKQIAITAYSPLGSPSSPFINEGSPVVIADPTLINIGSRYGKSAAQVALRWQIERGVIVIPRSTSKERIGSNADIFDFYLSAEDIEKINKMNINHRLYPMETWKESKYYPFNIEF